MTPILRAAIAFAERGYPLVPLIEDHEHLIDHSWRRKATSDVQDIYATFNRKRHNFGVLTGARAGIFVLEVDGKSTPTSGSRSLVILEEQHGKLPETWCSCHVPTGRVFYWFSLPPGHAAPSGMIGCGLRVRGEDEYVVAPPSVVGGRAHCWINGKQPGETELADAPDWLLHLIARLGSPE